MRASLVSGLVLIVCAASGRATMSFVLTSPAFDPNGSIPSKFTCEGTNVSPPLVWANAPDGTKSFALVIDDPDAPDPSAPKTTWVHWVVFNLPPTQTSVPEGFATTTQGLNDWQRANYGGPCPPIGRHRYVHKLYALDVELAGLSKPTKATLENAIAGHVLGKAELVGRYEKSVR